MLLKKDLKFSFTGWLKYTRFEWIVVTSYRNPKDERVIVNETLCLMNNKRKL